MAARAAASRCTAEVSPYFADACLEEGAVVLDVGANIGIITLEVLRRCPGAKVIAIEYSMLHFFQLA